jgi:hypothetical protein
LDFVQNALFFLEVIYPTSRADADRELCELVSTTVRNRINTMTQELDAAMTRAKAIMANECISSTTVHTIDKVQIVHSYSPLMTRWLTLLSTTDDYLCVLDDLWHAAYLTTDDRADQVTKWTQRLFSFTREILWLRKRVANQHHHRTNVEPQASDTQFSASIAGDVADHQVLAPGREATPDALPSELRAENNVELDADFDAKLDSALAKSKSKTKRATTTSELADAQ